MLDQNTDRMWYVIGAVIVGAAIILILNNTFPQLFASVGETFKSKTEQTTEIVDGIMPKKINENMIAYSDIGVHSYANGDVSITNFDKATGTWTVSLTPNMRWNDGLSTVPTDNKVPFGESYTISYEVWTPVDLSARPDINAYPVQGPQWSNPTNDSDDKTKRKMSELMATSGEWTKIWFTYTNGHAGNVNKVDLYDKSIFGLVNTTKETVEIKVRKIKGEISAHPTAYVPAIVDK